MLDLTLPLVLFLLPLAYSPGPGNLFFAAIGARDGTLASLPASLGYHCATWIVTCAVGFGFSNFLIKLPLAFTVIKYIGSIYVLWLAWQFFHAGTTQTKTENVTARFVDGVILLVLNPKAYMIITLMFTQFLPQNAPDFTQLVVYIATVFTLNNLLAFFVWTLLGDALSRLFRKEKHARAMNLVFALLLIFVALWMGMK